MNNTLKCTSPPTSSNLTSENRLRYKIIHNHMITFVIIKTYVAGVNLLHVCLSRGLLVKTFLYSENKSFYPR